MFSLVLLSSSIQSFAWGSKGHKLVVELAFSLLSPSARQKLLSYLDGYPIDNAAVWMDSVRGRHVREYQYMKNWHFIDMEEGQTYEQVRSYNDVVYSLQRTIDAFSHINTLSNDSINMNLRILFHLMGDITQPLHCGYGSDKGGNEIEVTTPKYNIKKNNLHHVWDDAIIQEGKITIASLQEYYRTLSIVQIKNAKKGTPKDWMLQSRGYLHTNVYAFDYVQYGVSTLSLDYLNKNVPLVKQQLTFAAIRLADVLERTFH